MSLKTYDPVSRTILQKSEECTIEGFLDITEYMPFIQDLKDVTYSQFKAYVALRKIGVSHKKALNTLSID